MRLSLSHALTSPHRYLWDELLGLFKAGVLKVPEGVRVVFTDQDKGKIGGLDDIHLADGLCVETEYLTPFNPIALLCYRLGVSSYNCYVSSFNPILSLFYFLPVITTSQESYWCRFRRFMFASYLRRSYESESKY